MKREFLMYSLRVAAALPLALLLAACSNNDAPVLPGTVEWDRVSVMAETAEPVREIRVKEGDPVQAGDVLMQLDARRTEAQLAAARAERDVAKAQLATLREGARRETQEAAKADAARLRAEADNAARERERAVSLQKQGLVADADVERAKAAAEASAAALRAAEARLSELRNGTRRSDIDAAAARVAALDANVEALALTRERLTVVAPRDARVDALPFRVGDQPMQGATLVSLLAGDAPYVRVFVPATLRASLAIGAPFTVTVEGVAEPFTGTLRSVRSDSAFTPYYALVGDDAARLVYRAEILLQGDAAKKLPAGLPASATPAAVRTMGQVPAAQAGTP